MEPHSAYVRKGKMLYNALVCKPDEYTHACSSCEKLSSIIWHYTQSRSLSFLIAVVCSSLSSPAHGNVMYNTSSILNNRYAHGTEETYNCSSGELFGNITKSCQSDGSWTGNNDTFCDSESMQKQRVIAQS